MKDFKVVIVNSANETVKYWVSAKNEAFAQASAVIRYDRFYTEKIRSIKVTPF